MHDIVIDDLDLFDSIELPDDASPADRALHEAAIATLLEALTIRVDADGGGSLVVVAALGGGRYLEWHAGLDGSTDGDRVVVATGAVADGDGLPAPAADGLRGACGRAATTARASRRGKRR